MAIALARPTEGRLHARKLTDYELGLYASAEFIENFGSVTSVADLKDAPLITYIDELLLAQELDFGTIVSEMRPVMKSSNIIAQLVSTCQSVGFCILPCFFADYYLPLRRVLTNEIKLIRTFWLVTHSDLRDLARVRVTSDYIVQGIQDKRRIFLPSEHGGPLRPFPQAPLVPLV
jgi:DNA-binding transcriptional LysR family regulator